MKLSLYEKNKIINRYNNRYLEHGYSPKTLGWDKGKQGVRFDLLTSFLELENKSILDIGCGFGDLNKTLQKKCNNYRYLGIDLVEQLVLRGTQLYNAPNIKFQVGDFLDMTFEHNFDYIIASGIFNFLLEDSNNYDYIMTVMERSFELCTDGFAFDFLSDKVDYKYTHTFHSSPEKILSYAYSLSKNVILRNDYMPFEFCIFVFKDSSFNTSDTIFTRYKHRCLNAEQNEFNLD